MFLKEKNYILNIYNVIFKRKTRDLIKFFLISTPGALAAFLEAMTFSLLLSSLYILNGKGIEIFKGKPIISRIAEVSFLQNISSNQLFLIMVIGAIGAQVLKSLIIYLLSVQAAKLNAKISCQVHKNIYEYILSFNFQTVSNYKTGSLSSYTQVPTNSIVPMLQAFHKVIVQLFVLAILGFFLFKISALLTIFFTAFFMISGFGYKKLLSIISKYSAKCAQKVLEYNNDVVQAINGIKIIHIFGLQKLILNRSHHLMQKMQKYQYGNAQLQSLLLAVGEIFSMIMMAATLGISSFFLVTTKEHSLPLLLTYTVTAYRFTTTSREILSYLGVIASQTGPIIKLNEILTTKDKGFEPTKGGPCPIIKQGIEFSSVSFKYPEKKEATLNNISLFIPHKKMTAIVGLSGAGKSSLITLITRLFDPSKGKILIDGVDLNNYNIGSWRSKLGVVTQNAIIFNDPARENISFGMEISDKKILKACQDSGCYEVIKKLPNGLDTPLGEHGYKISGGEAQRIAIARAIIREPDILIFDEATSNLDSRNEQIILDTLDQHRDKCTLIVIAHRLSTISSADQIIVLKNGMISEVGTHSELVEMNKDYAHLWQLQSKTKRSLEPIMV